MTATDPAGWLVATSGHVLGAVRVSEPWEGEGYTIPAGAVRLICQVEARERGNEYLLQCQAPRCRCEFWHRADRWRITCPHCRRWGKVEDVRRQTPASIPRCSVAECRAPNGPCANLMNWSGWVHCKMGPFREPAK